MMRAPHPCPSLWPTVALAAASGVAWAAPEPAEPVGVVTGVVGIDVELRRRDTPADYVQLGLPLREDDEIRVPAGQSAMVLLPGFRTVLQIDENTVVRFRGLAAGLTVRVSEGTVRAFSSDAAATNGLHLATPLGRCAMAVGILDATHRVGETAGASRSSFALSADATGPAVAVERIGGSESTPLSPGTVIVVRPLEPLTPATRHRPPTAHAAARTRALPLAAAREHRLRVADDFRDNMVQRTALAAVLQAPPRLRRAAPQTIIDQPTVQPPGPTQVTRVATALPRAAPRVTSDISRFAQQSLGEFFGLLPRRGPVPTAGPNSLIGATR